jgi:hypothetical protein
MFVASAKRDDVEVAVDQSRQNATATQVYRAGRGADQRHNIVLLRRHWRPAVQGSGS